MAVSLKPLGEQVMVITGATSGIGLATARMAAEAGTRLVLAARSGADLAEVARQIDQTGNQVVTVAADVSRREDVGRIADAAVRHFGGFDTWVNNAAVSIWGRIEEGRVEDYRRLFDVNLWGLVHGSLVAVRYLKQRGGALINLGSVASENAIPLQGIYSASKHAVKGFTDALRMELEEEGAPVSVTLIKPHAINTPLPHHACNYGEREPRLPDPAYEPEEVARAILFAATHPERDIYVGGTGRVMTAVGHQAPRAMDWMGEHVLMKQSYRDEPARDPAGNLYQPGRGGHAHGDHPGYVRGVSLYTRTRTHPVLTQALLAAAGVAAVAWWEGSLAAKTGE